MLEINARTVLFLLGWNNACWEWREQHGIAPSTRNVVHLHTWHQTTGVFQPLYLRLHGWDALHGSDDLLHHLSIVGAVEAGDDVLSAWLVLNRRSA